MLKISVAITTYNGEKYISEQLSSIMNQIRKPDEVVIVDDASTDNTPSMIKAFIEENGLEGWRLIENKENLGFIKNYRKVLLECSGDVILLCDQDDVWYEDKVESVSSVMAQNPQIIALNTSFAIIDNFGAVTGRSAKRNNYGLIDKILKRRLEKISLTSEFHSNISPGCTMAIKKELAEDYVRLSKCELPHDYELNVMAAARGGLYFYDAVLMKYRLHDNNLIGLTPKRASRIDIAKERLALAGVVLNVTGKDGLYKVCEERLSALSGISFGRILKLWLNKDYNKYFPLRERIGDILYILGRR
ncbi:MAG: glycosyltransferase [Clostridia bacterium]|nr:glycosyltransferase [Clostridia bacterium]